LANVAQGSLITIPYIDNTTALHVLGNDQYSKFVQECVSSFASSTTSADDVGIIPKIGTIKQYSLVSDYARLGSLSSYAWDTVITLAVRLKCSESWIMLPWF
jgi:hypothetical protein